MERFTDAGDTAQRAAELISAYADEQGLVRTDVPEHDSVRWGVDEKTPVLWLYPAGDQPGLELWLGGLPDAVRRPLALDLRRFGADDDEAPRIGWDVVLDRWDELRDGPVTDYLDGHREQVNEA